MKEIMSIDNILNFIDEEKKLNPDNELFFRGQRTFHEEVIPSIARKGNNHLENEDIMFKEFILRNPSDFDNEKTTFQKLTKMQHYSLPTRLLDISSNPLVGLYFAVGDSDEKDSNDGDFIIYSIPKNYIKYYDSDTVSAVSNISRRPTNSFDISKVNQKKCETYNKWIKRFNKHPHILYLLHEIKDEKPYFQNIIVKNHLESIWCVKPLLNNRRIIKQDGAFLLFGIDKSKANIAKYNPDHFTPKRFAVKNKKKLREQLSLLGLTKDKIYPELDTTAEFLKDRYK